MNWIVYGCLSFSGLNWGGVSGFLPGAPSANIEEEQKNLLMSDLICHKGSNLMQVDISWQEFCGVLWGCAKKDKRAALRSARLPVFYCLSQIKNYFNPDHIQDFPNYY